MTGIKAEGNERRYISKEMCELLDKIKENVSEFAWSSLRITDAEASRILVKKVADAKLV